MQHRLRTVVPLVAIPLAVVAGSVGTAAAAAPSASTQLTSTFSSAPLTSADLAAAKANVAILKGPPATFSKRSVSGKRTPASATRCTAANSAFTLTNSSGKKQTLKVQGKVFATVPAGTKGFVCGVSSKAFSATFVLASNPGAKLTAHFS